MDASFIILERSMCTVLQCTALNIYTAQCEYSLENKKHYILINITPWNKSLTCFQLVFRNMFSCLIVQLLLKEGAAKSMKFMIDWFQKCHSFRPFSNLVKHKLALLKDKFSNKKLCVYLKKTTLMYVSM